MQVHLVNLEQEAEQQHGTEQLKIVYRDDTYEAPLTPAYIDSLYNVTFGLSCPAEGYSKGANEFAQYIVNKNVLMRAARS